MVVLVLSQVSESPTLIVTDEMAVEDPVVVYRYWSPVGLITPIETVAALKAEVDSKIRRQANTIFRVSGIRPPKINLKKFYHRYL
jgi:hypothetical protein